LFKAKPNDNPKWPQYEGSALIDGVEYWLSAWVKEGKSGKFFSLSFKPKVPGSHAKPIVLETSKGPDSIPF
jgi:hypothetical protein